ncbi:hypothetical protein CEXT_508081 [Caerostris extrusa]|uniref:Uncharacterized protein n=1 Tax=Caerostris extrusa TaxID=172846 RepID=A0AAV4Y0C4_CAEEX|nr:hypothetical protein CEXT_508081 [Caerostris extrusa]
MQEQKVALKLEVERFLCRKSSPKKTGRTVSGKRKWVFSNNKNRRKKEKEEKIVEEMQEQKVALKLQVERFFCPKIFSKEDWKNSFRKEEMGLQVIHLSYLEIGKL